MGAHHQNEIIERHQQCLTSYARTILLHVKRHWPEMISTTLWSFAFKYVELLYSHLHLDTTGLSPIETFLMTPEKLFLNTLHTWGSSFYVLDEKLQSTNIIPKWDPRSQLHIYLGRSPCHAGPVALVLNPNTFHVSPQYHIVFDDDFSTVPFLASEDVLPNWAELVRVSERVTAERCDLAELWCKFQVATPTYPTNREGELASALKKSTSERAQNKVSFDEEATTIPEGDHNNYKTILMQPTLPDLNEFTRRTSNRQSKPSAKVKDSNDPSTRKMFGLATCLKSEFNGTRTFIACVVHHYHEMIKLFDGTINRIHHFAFLPNSYSNDTFTLSRMLKRDYIKEFAGSMVKEVQDHEDRGHWKIFERSNMPEGSKIILSVCAFKIKRFMDGRINKYKFRMNAHGGMQRWGIDYWETYAPVVNWISVRFLLALAIIHGLETKSIDFVLAFPQVDLGADVFMELPFGFEFGPKGKFVLKLNKNLYGLKSAASNWFLKISKGLESENFVKSEVDQCVFIRHDCIVLVYVDDVIALARDGSVPDKLVANLKEKQFDLTDDGTLDKYLGVDIKHNLDGSFELSQPYLIERTLKVLGVEGDSKTNSKPTPAP